MNTPMKTTPSKKATNPQAAANLRGNGDANHQSVFSETTRGSASQELEFGRGIVRAVRRILRPQPSRAAKAEYVKAVKGPHLDYSPTSSPKGHTPRQLLRLALLQVTGSHNPTRGAKQRRSDAKSQRVSPTSCSVQASRQRSDRKGKGKPQPTKPFNPEATQSKP
jgi:hypothetical protein